MSWLALLQPVSPVKFGRKSFSLDYRLMTFREGSVQLLYGTLFPSIQSILEVLGMLIASCNDKFNSRNLPKVCLTSLSSFSSTLAILLKFLRESQLESTSFPR